MVSAHKITKAIISNFIIFALFFTMIIFAKINILCFIMKESFFYATIEHLEDVHTLEQNPSWPINSSRFIAVLPASPICHNVDHSLLNQTRDALAILGTIDLELRIDSLVEIDGSSLL